MLIPDKADFRTRKIIRDKYGHYIMIKGSICQEDITILNVYVPDNRASKYVRQKLVGPQRKTDASTIIVKDFNTPLSVIDRTSRQKISKDIVERNCIVNHLDLIDIYRLLHPTTAEYTFFSSSHGTFTKIDHILGDKTHLNKFKRLDIIQSVFSDHSRIKLEINNRQIAGISKYLKIKQCTSK